MTINEGFDKVRALKERAVTLRNRGKLDSALDTLNTAVDQLETMRIDASHDGESTTTSIRAELADTYGMRGGIHRRRKDLTAALADYKGGLALEEAGGSSTYNLGNVIVLSIVLNEAKLDDPAVKAKLRQVLERLGSQTTGPRSDEWWAWADLGQFRLLAGDLAGAREAYLRGKATGPLATETLRPLEVLDEIGLALKASDPVRAEQVRAFTSEIARELGVQK